jgi:putative membrane protein
MTAIFEALGSGLPVLALQFATTLALLAAGAAIYMALTPFHERDLIAAGNTAAGVVLAGTLLALAIPLAATLATSAYTLDILLWGIVALVIQLVTFRLASLFIKGLREMIEQNNVAAACALTGIQLSVALLNAGAMAG